MKKRELKKEIKYVLYGIIGLIAITIIFLLLKKDNKNISGNKVADGLYIYQLEEKKSIQNASVRENGIYYLIDSNNKYKLYEFNIYKNKTKEIGTIESDYCSLNNYYLLCVKNENTTIYDINLKEIYNSDKAFTIIPYQDSFLIVNEKEIYLKDEKFRSIKDDIKRFDIIEYYASNDNTFIGFISLDDIYIYNVKEDTYEKIDSDNIYLHEKGMYYSSKNKIIVRNLDNNTTTEYNNINIDNFQQSTINNNTLFYNEYGYLKIYNLDTNKLKYIDYKFDKAIDKIVFNNNYLYLIYQGENPEIYIVKIEEINSKEYTVAEYKEKQLKEIKEKVKKIEDKYNNVYIIYDTKDISDYDKWNQKIVNEDRLEVLDKAIDTIGTVLDKFGKDFLSIFKHDDYKGLRIVIAKKIETDEDDKVKGLAGFFFANYIYYNIIVADDSVPYDKSLCHEMMHAIDYNASNNNYDLGSKWYDYNPSYFAYGINHYTDGDMNYTVLEGNNVYFIDNYSMINQDEDRARVFENICYVKDENIIKKYSNLLKKAEYIKEELIKYYPVISDSKVFDSMK